jgi:hypothetical protein
LSQARPTKVNVLASQAGKNMDGFLALVLDIIKANGLAHAEIHQNRAMLTLPGYFRPTKLWDLLVIYKGELIAAIELKSQVGPSFGNNFNNRTEEAIGTAHDLWTAYREEAFGKQPRPFVGWLMMVEDAPGPAVPFAIRRHTSRCSRSSRGHRISSGMTCCVSDWCRSSFTPRQPSLQRNAVRWTTGDFTELSSI